MTINALLRRVALGVALLGSASAWAASVLHNLDVQLRDDVVVATFSLSNATAHQVFTLTAPDRVVIDLEDAALGPASLSLPSDADSLLTGVRHGYQADGRLRIVIDLRQQVRVAEQVSVTDSGDWKLSLALTATSVAAASSEAGETGELEELRADTRDSAGTGADATAGRTGTASKEPARTESMVFGESGKPAQDDGPAGGSMVFGSSSASPPGDESSTGTMVFGATDPSKAETPDDPVGRWRPQLQRGLAEGGYLYEDEYRPGSNLHMQFVGTLTGTLTDQLEVRLGARFDGHYQGGDAPDHDMSELDYDETWFRYSAGDWRFTAGGQRILWGRADEISPTDRLSTRDFTRFILDDLPDRRRANPALRLEWFGDDLSFDLVYLPEFREAELPDAESIWSPIDAERGAIAGLKIDPELAQALRGAMLENDVSGDGGGGVRMKRTGETVDYALTVQRVRNPEPYFTLGRQTPNGPVLDTVYPRTWVAGGDFGLAVANWTLRFEGAWLSDAPYTSASDLQLQTTEAVNWVLGGEVFPGDRDLRLTIQIAGTHLLDADNPIDREDILALTGEIEGPFADNRWRGQLRWWAGLNRDDLYLNPEIVFTGWEPSEVYLGLNLFQGERGTLGDFYDRNDMIVLGWRGRF